MPAPAANVCAVVVTFHPNAEVAESIALLRQQVGRVVIVDNAASADSRSWLESMVAGPEIEVIFNEQNVGVATALNQGVQRALAGGYEWVATFDQDSRIPAGFIDRMLAAHGDRADRDRIGVIAPVYRDRNLGFVYSASEPLPEDARGAALVSVAGTSGNLVAARALRDVDGFRDDFFIDCVDFEFCLRCRSRGWLILEVRDVVLDHAQGTWTSRRFLWKRPKVNDYDATRRYYQARNRIVMYARFGAVDPYWLWRDARGYVWDLAKLVLFCRDRGPKVRAVLTGLWDAATGRRGAWGDRRPGPSGINR